MFEALIDVGVSSQGEATSVGGRIYWIFNHNLCIYGRGRGCIRPMVSYGIYGAIPRNFVSMFE